MKVAIVTSGAHPLPLVEGGAIQTLVSFYLDANEQSHNCDFTVFSNYNTAAYDASKAYRYSQFIYIKTSSVFYKIGMIINGLKKKITKKETGSYFSYSVNKYLKKDKYDAVVIEASPHHIYGIERQIDTKYILHLHNDFLNNTVKQAREKLSSFDAVFTNSQFIAERVREIDSAYTGIYVLRNAIEVSKFQKRNVNKSDIRHKFALPLDNRLLILYTGRITPDKGCLELVKAYIDSNELRNKAILVLAGGVGFGENGESEYASNLMKEISAYPNDIFYTGFIKYDELVDLYKSADIGVVPSIWEEAFGLTAVEHMASENALIVTDSGELPAIVSNECGIVVHRANIVPELKNACEELCRNQYRRAELISNAVIRVNEYNREDYTQRYFKLLNEVLS